MTRTNWSRFSKLALALVVLLSAFAGQAGAVSVASDDVPDERSSGGEFVEAFNGEEFSLTTNLANEAETSANQARQSSQTTQLLIYAAGGLLVVALIVGGFLYWRSQQTTYDKLG